MGVACTLGLVKTHTFACVGPLSALASFTRVSCWSSNPLKLSPVLLQVLNDEGLPSSLGVQGSKDFPASRCVASSFSEWADYHVQQENYNTYIPQTLQYCLTWRCWGTSPGTDSKIVVLIPVVTFLTPLTLNSRFERIDRPSFPSLYLYWKSKSSQLLPFCSTWDFCSHWADLRTPVLLFNRCAAPAKLPTWRCHLRSLQSTA